MTANIKEHAAPEQAGELDISKLAPKSRAHVDRENAERAAVSRVDGRTLRRSGRTEALSFKVKPETVEQIQRLARAEDMTMVEILEKAIDQYERHLKGSQ